MKQVVHHDDPRQPMENSSSIPLNKTPQQG